MFDNFSLVDTYVLNINSNVYYMRIQQKMTNSGLACPQNFGLFRGEHLCGLLKSDKTSTH